MPVYVHDGEGVGMGGGPEEEVGVVDECAGDWAAPVSPGGIEMLDGGVAGVPEGGGLAELAGVLAESDVKVSKRARRCKECGKVCGVAAKFCTQCGKPVVRGYDKTGKKKKEPRSECPGCGMKRVYKDGERFCPKCGTEVVGAPAGKTA